MRNPRGYTSSVVYDGLGRSVLSTDAISNSVETIYDNNSNVLQTKRTEVETSTQTYYSDYHYDAADRQILSVDTLGNTHRSSYDSARQLLASTDANSSGTASIATQSRAEAFRLGAAEPDETEGMIYQCFEGFDKVLAPAPALLAPAWNAFGNPTKSPPGQ